MSNARVPEMVEKADPHPREGVTCRPLGQMPSLYPILGAIACIHNHEGGIHWSYFTSFTLFLLFPPTQLDAQG